MIPIYSLIISSSENLGQELIFKNSSKDLIIAVLLSFFWFKFFNNSSIILLSGDSLGKDSDDFLLFSYSNKDKK